MLSKILCTVWLFVLFLCPAFTQAAELTALEPLITRSTRLIVFSPHPDDETLGAGGLIQRVLEAGGRVKVVFMTNGDGYPEGVELQDHTTHPTALDFTRYGQIRRLEALSALTTLGMKTKNVIFLGFPDGGLPSLRSKSWAHHVPYRSPFTRKCRPPWFETVIPRADFCAKDLTDEIERVIVRFKPTLLATTGPEDQHPDHKFTYYFVEQALDRLTMKSAYLRPEVITFVIHYNGWPVNQEARSGARLPPPEGFPVRGRKWISFDLKPWEVSVKRKAILKYRSQMVMLSRFLLCFDKSDELFRQDPGHGAALGCLQLSKQSANAK
ncbi:MAG: PIG-L family deacetylase [Syntrophobacteraceae bacterium]|nr:PIG-L family deacetylase [Syntrophobacteraceae bacterium]